jgi:anaphase-promoting complex subunit 2
MGIPTPLIIEMYIKLIKLMKELDPSQYMLEACSLDIKRYLTGRKDTMRCIIGTIFNYKEESLLTKNSIKQFLRSGSNVLQTENYDENISSDEDEFEAEKWEPLPLDNKLLAFGGGIKNKSSDIMSTLITIFGSPEKFVEQYKRMLSERAVSDSRFSLENEINNLNLLKEKFGSSLFQPCEVLISDIRESVKIGQQLNQNTVLKDFNINCLVINKNYWPFKEHTVYDIEEENMNSNTHFDNFLKVCKINFDNFNKSFNAIKFTRTLSFFTNIGHVDLTLTFDNGNFDFRVSPLTAMIIKMFDEVDESSFKSYSIDYISDKLNCSINDVKKKIGFLINKGVLSEFDNIEDEHSSYFIPNKTLNVKDAGIIIEEDIFLFEFVAEGNNINIENAISSIIKNCGPRNFEQLYKNLLTSYQVNITELKFKEILGKLILEQKIIKDGEDYKVIIS